MNLSSKLSLLRCLNQLNDLATTQSQYSTPYLQPLWRGMHSDIHVVVRFHEQSVFAGEHLRCTITFRNVANHSEPVTPALPARRSSRRESISQIASQAARNHAAARVGLNGRTNNSGDHSIEVGGRHRPSASFHTPPSASDTEVHHQRPVHKQQRSVSIISVTSPITAGDLADSNTSSWAKQQRLSHHHRSSTVGNTHGTSSVDRINRIFMTNFDTRVTAPS